MKQLLILTALLLASASLNAQSPVGGRDRGPGQRPDEGGHPGWEQIESMKIAFFTSEMELTPDEAAGFWPIYNQYSKEQRELGRSTHELYLKMEEAVRKGNLSDVEMKKLIGSYEDARIRETELIRLYTDEFYKVLSPEKTARLFMAEEHFRFKMINTWRAGRPGPDAGKGIPSEE